MTAAQQLSAQGKISEQLAQAIQIAAEKESKQRTSEK
jgi:hypothetical protein